MSLLSNLRFNALLLAVICLSNLWFWHGANPNFILMLYYTFEASPWGLLAGSLLNDSLIGNPWGSSGIHWMGLFILCKYGRIKTYSWTGNWLNFAFLAIIAQGYFWVLSMLLQKQYLDFESFALSIIFTIALYPLCYVAFTAINN